MAASFAARCAACTRALRGGVAYRPVLSRTDGESPLRPPANTPYWHLAYVAKESFANLSLEPWPEAGEPLEPGQVRVEMKAAGLNWAGVKVTAPSGVTAGVQDHCAGPVRTRRNTSMGPNAVCPAAAANAAGSVTPERLRNAAICAVRRCRSRSPCERFYFIAGRVFSFDRYSSNSTMI